MAGAMGTTVDTPRLGSGDGSRDFAAGERRRHWRPKEWSPHEKLGNGPTPLSSGNRDDSGDLVAGDLRQHWRLCGWGLETTRET